MRLLIAILLLASCRAPQVITETEVRDSVIVREVPKYIEIPGQTVYSPAVNLDSLVQVIQSGVKSETINRTLTYTDPDTQLQVGLLIDQLGNITAVCEQQEQTIQVLEREIERYRQEVTRVETRKPKGLWDIIGSYLIVPMAIVFLLLLLIFWFRMTR